MHEALATRSTTNRARVTNDPRLSRSRRPHGARALLLGLCRRRSSTFYRRQSVDRPVPAAAIEFDCS